MSTPQETDAVSPVAAMDHTSISSLTGQGIAWDRSSDRIVNVLKGENLGFDHGSGFVAERITWRNGTSTGTWGAAEPLEIDMTGFRNAQEARARFESVAQTVFSNWGQPFLTLAWDVTQAALVWLVDINDVVSITHDAVPKVAGVGRGVTDLLVRVYGRDAIYRQIGAGGVRGRLYGWTGGSTGNRYSQWAPSAYGSTVGGSPSGIDVTVDASYYSDATESNDVTYFAAGYQVRLYNPGNEGGAEIRTIDSIAGNMITLTSATTLSAPVVVEFADYDNASTTAAQQRYLYLSDGDRVINKSSGSDRAFYYQ